jgi:hypothetical protein
VEAANEAGGADNVTVLLVRVLTTTPSEVAEAQSHAEHTEAPGTASASHGLGAMSASSIISTVDLPWRWLRKMTGKDEPTTEAAAEEPTPSLKEKKRFWSNKRTEAQESAETSFWKQELHWPWRNRAMKRLGDETPEPAPVQPPKDLPVAPQKESPVSRQPGEQAGEPEESKLRRLRQKKSAASPAWDPNVLRTLEERLAEYIGPVAKILVRRAANETRDIDELCQLLATQLATEQEKKNFLRTVNPH